MKPKYTPGPWTVDIQGASSYVRECQTSPFEKGQMIAKTWGETNARLIAAAPEMLEALENALAWIDRSHKYGSDMESSRLSCLLDASGILSDAIKKARGES